MSIKLIARLSAAALTSLGAGAFLCSCASSESSTNADQPSVQTENRQPKAPPTTVAPRRGEKLALHNVHKLNDRIISGGVPQGDAAFDELREMGIRTIISVDGATPDVARAESRGIRYVHIPITYAEVTETERLEIAKAIRDLPGPVYVHCHHGKHRSPAAVAAAGVALGVVTPDEGVAFMKSAGTAPNYAGLYACVATATVLSAAEIDAAPTDFPAQRKAHGIVAAMVETDEANEFLGKIREAGWAAPANHPDLLPAVEAGKIADNLRFSREDPEAAALGPDFAKRLAGAVAAATALEDAIVAGAGASELESKYRLVQASCKDCHAVYRDKPQPKTK